MWQAYCSVDTSEVIRFPGILVCTTTVNRKGGSEFDSAVTNVFLAIATIQRPLRHFRPLPVTVVLSRNVAVEVAAAEKVGEGRRRGRQTLER